MTQTAFPREATIFAGICACIFVFVGVFGNLITILALVKCPKMRGHATSAFVLSLCISDLLFCCFSLPLTSIRFFKEAWILGETLCKIFPVMFYGNVAVSLLSMVGITLNRYILIACYNLYLQIYKPRLIAYQLIFIWASAFFMMLPPILGIWGELGLDEATFSCTILKKDGKSIKKYLFLIGFLVPCLVIIISYSCIYFTVRKQRCKLRTYSSSIEKAIATSKQQEDNRLTIMMLTIFICFLGCFLPLMLVNVVDENNTSYPWLHIFASIMAWASSVINPFIYAVSNRNYRLAYCKIFALLKFWTDNSLSQPSSKSHQCSKNSKNVPINVRSTPTFDAADRVKSFSQIT